MSNQTNKKENKEEYNGIPVVACKYCSSLNIQEDSNGNDLCMRCGAINEIENFPNINEYLKIHNGK